MFNRTYRNFLFTFIIVYSFIVILTGCSSKPKEEWTGVTEAICSTEHGTVISRTTSINDGDTLIAECLTEGEVDELMDNNYA